jgi:uncharacterized protein YggE
MKIDSILEISEETGYAPMNGMYKFAEAAAMDTAGTQVMASQLQVSATVNILFMLVEAE